jgi:hypothetical protein
MFRQCSSSHIHVDWWTPQWRVITPVLLETLLWWWWTPSCRRCKVTIGLMGLHYFVYTNIARSGVCVKVKAAGVDVHCEWHLDQVCSWTQMYSGVDGLLHSMNSTNCHSRRWTRGQRATRMVTFKSCSHTSDRRRGKNSSRVQRLTGD